MSQDFIGEPEKNYGKFRFRKRLGFFMIAFSSLFLFNPDFTVVDILPDIFGYLLIYFGLDILSDLNDYIDVARRKFKLMIFVSGIKIFSIFSLFGMNDGYMLPFSLLLYPFAFAVVEMIILIPAYKNLFDGILYLSARHDGTNATLPSYPGAKEKGKVKGAKNITSVIQSSTFFFIGTKAIMSFAPELSALTMSTYDETKKYIDLYDYVNLMRAVAIIIALVVGISWMVQFVRYFKFISADGDFVKNVTALYRERIENNESLHILRSIKMGFLMLTIAAFLFVDFYVDFANIIPDILAVLFAALGLYSLKKYIKAPKFYLSFAILGLLGISDIIRSIVNLTYNNKFGSFGYIFREAEAYDLFVSMCTSTAVEAVLFLISVVVISWALLDIIYGHCGYVGHDWGSEFGKRQHDALISELKAPIKRSIMLAGMSALFTFVYDFTKQYRTNHTFLSDSFIKTFPKLSDFIRNSTPGTVGLLDLVFAVAFAVSLSSALNDIYYGVEQRYSLD